LKRRILFAVTLLIALPLAAAAQDAIEVGTDAGFQLTLPETGDNVTSIFAPGSWVRIGFPITPTLGIEPVANFSYSSTDDASVTRFGVFPYLVYNFSEPRGDSPFLKIGAGISFTDVDTNVADSGTTIFGIGGAVGTRFGISDAFSMRIEGGFDHWFESDEAVGFNLLKLLVGFSVFVD
jgi:hypothetical protein